MKRVFPVLIVITAIVFYSCQKELHDGATTPPVEPPVNVDSSNLIDSIKGDWNFVDITAETQSSSEYVLPGSSRKTLAFMDYITTNNHGTVTIDDSMIHTMDITYTVSSTIKTYTYVDGVLIDSNETSINMAFPETESIAPYKVIGADSIFFPKGGFTDIAASRFKTRPSAAKKVVIEGNTLLFNKIFLRILPKILTEPLITSFKQAMRL